MTEHHHFMQRAIELARQTSIVERAGGPFGCVIVRGDEIIAEGANRVIAEKDPTWHAEMAAIRTACSAIGTHDLSDCILYTSCEPCPMCYAAAWWARIDTIYYATTAQDAKECGNFDDVPIHEAVKLPGPDRALPVLGVEHEEMLKIWREFRDMPDRPHY
ncbi:MAG: nucleoside deaminase [Phycisphaerales bacterium]|mgnify:FL=1|jgi:tRNA(Arg) A34 adenosine deaminase TadA|nr:tRNA-specific adenosine deaminase [Planctomycetaceae bacterium]MDP6158437.1 nucleoside deaminase [Phycisphaerales bacterium]MDP6311297.1 nucleoside deaminase [Phycisphaerales bacterium]MDP7085994.1 nucleoside deaminase [Phycisphaerales bacterium]MDP7189685.1 nucleoside deaminase [Phycisphaerales bacterium]|tara:strand:+ start:1586 stop:2065 length:480 start_codon:yes stop_codon:yes gene_type:complete